MSIFSVLRWSISMPPRAEELEALPHDLFMQWIESSDWREHYGDDIDKVYIAQWYSDVWASIHQWYHEKDIKDLATLKKLIADYEDPEV